MSSKALDSRGARAKVSWAGAAGQLPRKQRYVAVTSTDDVYEVLKARTSDKKGAAPTIEATAGIVIRAGEG
jgi:hypothetical protein